VSEHIDRLAGEQAQSPQGDSLAAEPRRRGEPSRTIDSDRAAAFLGRGRRQNQGA